MHGQLLRELELIGTIFISTATTLCRYVLVLMRLRVHREREGRAMAKRSGYSARCTENGDEVLQIQKQGVNYRRTYERISMYVCVKNRNVCTTIRYECRPTYAYTASMYRGEKNFKSFPLLRTAFCIRYTVYRSYMNYIIFCSSFLPFAATTAVLIHNTVLVAVAAST